MQFEEFVEDVTRRTEKICGPEFRVSSFRMMKNNSVGHMGLSIMEKGSSISPAIYLDDMYTDFCDGRSIDDIINDVLRIYSQNRDIDDFNVRDFASFEAMRSHIVYRLVSFSQNRELLEKIPHRQFLDLAVIYSVNLGSTKNGNASVTVYNEHMDIWGTDEQTLFGLAAANTPEMLPAQIVSMSEMVCSLAEETGDCDMLDSIDGDDGAMYILSNKSRFYGASCVLYDGVLEKFAETMGTDLFIIPSSVHEVILVPDRGNIDPAQLTEMISDVNCTQVSPEEILSYDLYRYSCKKRMMNTVR